MTADGPVLVTGASTGIGNATTARLLDAGREVISLDQALLDTADFTSGLGSHWIDRGTSPL